MGQAIDFLWRHKKGLMKKVLTKKALNFSLKTYPNLTKPKNFVQSYGFYALTPAAGCQDHSKPYLRGLFYSRTFLLGIFTLGLFSWLHVWVGVMVWCE